MDTVISIADVVIVGAYGAMLAICMICAELVKKRDTLLDAAEVRREEAERKQVEAETAREVAVALRSSLERQLVEQTDQLEAANRELDLANTDRKRLRSSGSDAAPKAPWLSVPLMNRSESTFFDSLNAVLDEAGQGHRAFSQVAYGGFLKVPDGAMKNPDFAAAYFAVARKRVDFLVIDRFGYPVIAIEFQGHGHYCGNADERDQAKRVACRKAGLWFLEVGPEGLSGGQRLDIMSALLSDMAAE